MLAGFGFAMLVAALHLAYVAIRADAAASCAEQGLSPQECALELEAAEELARHQALSALALSLLGLATFVYLRWRVRRES